MNNSVQSRATERTVVFFDTNPEHEHDVFENGDKCIVEGHCILTNNKPGALILRMSDGAFGVVSLKQIKAYT